MESCRTGFSLKRLSSDCPFSNRQAELKAFRFGLSAVNHTEERLKRLPS